MAYWAPTEPMYQEPTEWDDDMTPPLMSRTEDEYEDSGRNETTESTVYLSNYESQQGMQQEAYMTIPA